MKCVLSNDEVGLCDLLAEICPEPNDQVLPDQHWINKPCGNEHNNKTLLQIAMEKENLKMTQLLLKAGAKADYYNDLLGKCHIHISIELVSEKLLKILLESFDKNKANVDSMDQNGKTALHLASEKGHLNLVQILLDSGANVDCEDGLGRRTPLYIAAKNKDKALLKILLENGACTLNTCYGKTIQELIEENIPGFDTSEITVKKKSAKPDPDFGHGLKRILDKASLNLRKKQSNSQLLIQFKIVLSRFSATELDSYNADGKTLLQNASDYGLHEFASLLLDQGADPNQTLTECGTSPVLFASYHGHFELMDIFVNHKISSIESTKTASFSSVERTSGESVLHYLLNIPNRREKTSEEIKDYEKCLELLLETEDSRIQDEILQVINHKDSRGNVPLHYAANLWPQSIIRKLLDRGANIGIKNIWDELPIGKIMPETMENFLNEHCLTSNGHPVTSEDLEITFDYSFLAPPVSDENLDDQQEQIDKQALPETECLWYMGQSKQHRHLLKHPVVTSFLWLKWQRIRGYFNRNLRFYLLFVTALTWYIFARYGGISTRLSNYNATLTPELDQTGFCSELSSRSYSSPKASFWFVIFCVQVGLQFVLMLRDWKRDVQNCQGACEAFR